MAGDHTGSKTLPQAMGWPLSIQYKGEKKRFNAQNGMLSGLNKFVLFN